MTAPDTLSTRNVTITLVATPFIVAAALLPVVGYLLVARGVEPDALEKTLQPLIAWPVAIGFMIALGLCWKMAGGDGYRLRDLGWQPPTVADIALGLGLGGLVGWLNSGWVFPLIEAVKPGFDPTLSAIDAPTLMAMMAVSIVAEDTLYRGYALVHLERRYGTLAAVGLTSFSYALLAPGQGLWLIGWAACFGTALCGLRLWRGNLWPVVIVHWLVALAPRLLR